MPGLIFSNPNSRPIFIYLFLCQLTKVLNGYAYFSAVQMPDLMPDFD